MALRNVLGQFRQSRILRKKMELEIQQKRTAFKYWKLEHQENMDGAAKARQVFKRIPRQSVLAPKYRLRPFSERYHRKYSRSKAIWPCQCINLVYSSGLVWTSLSD